MHTIRLRSIVPVRGRCLVLLLLTIITAHGQDLPEVRLASKSNPQSGAVHGIVPLMREGQPAQGCHPAIIDTISRMGVDPIGGSYAVLCTLSAAPADANQALYRGQCTTGVLPDKAALRAPELFLRKGILYFNQPGKLKSITLPSSNLTASGAGGTGRGQAVAGPNLITVIVDFENGVRQIMANSP